MTFTPPKPAVFAPDVPPPGFELNLVSFWQERPIIVPRLQLFHTNGAPGQGSVEASKNWAERGGGNTIPHLQIDRTHNGVPRGALLLPSNRKGIANFRAADFSLGFETADTGTNDDPAISPFDDGQLELCAIAAAYYHVLHGIPLEFPTAWDGAGTASHTEPFGFPFWTNSNGKICPGLRKKAQVRDVILPRAREIVAAWTAPPPPEPPEEEIDLKTLYVGAHQNKDGDWQWWEGDLSTRSLITQSDLDEALRLVSNGLARVLHMATLEAVQEGQRPKAIDWNKVRRLGAFDTAGQLGPKDS